MKNTFQTIHSLHQAAEGSIVELRGWVAGRRDSKGLCFVVFRDGSGYCQCVFSQDDLGEELFELAVELRGQRFVVRHDDGRTLQCLHHISHGEGFSRSRDPQQNLRGETRLHARNQLLDRSGLVTRWRIIRL